eukprot:5856836-Alexandrium_andersonii.AAC.1
MRRPARAALRLASAEDFRAVFRPILEDHLQSHPDFENHFLGLMGGVPPLAEGERPPGLLESELSGLRMKALAALGWAPQGRTSA